FGDGELLASFERLLEDLESGLHALSYEGLEHLVIHGDATNDNVILAVDCEDPESEPGRAIAARPATRAIVGLIDFGSAHLAPWPCDLAAALWRSGRPDPNSVAYDLGRIGGYVAGYAREAALAVGSGLEPAGVLTSEVAAAIPLLMQGRGLQLISRRV